MSLRALIWDVDGTLAETERDGHLPAFNAAFAEAGLPWRWSAEQYRQLLAVPGGKERLLAWWQQVDPAAAAQPGLAERLRALHAAKTRHYTRRVASGGVALRPGVARLLGQARAQGVALAIATTTTRDNVSALLQATLGEGAEAWFAVIVAGDEVPRKKPAPDVYLAALQQLGLPAGAALAIEDSAPGVAAARAAGLPVLLTRSDYGPPDLAPLPPAALLADLDGLGGVAAPARGRLLPAGAAAQPWQGRVQWPDLQAWHAAWHAAWQGAPAPAATGSA
ncbi:HAD-IA family hydrolase [Aquabacterium sp. OR-4]|uniref:HAD-IA family hydrolase n=1 Tax=Aquabacterium sp. OR-4 TaxID=2978127 RepID=UPI0021B1AAED|nr:HAD-IA family hydrolase [Aquabacterium sp. OR-4]MDT7836406.1 HAD-IA family hydrolase [Aquabacterium sp. OR-4]